MQARYVKDLGKALLTADAAVWKGRSGERVKLMGTPVAQLSAGVKTGFAVAIWEGGAGEHAGIKAFSGDWQELVLEGVPTAAARG